MKIENRGRSYIWLEGGHVLPPGGSVVMPDDEWKEISRGPVIREWVRRGTLVVLPDAEPNTWRERFFGDGDGDV